MTAPELLAALAPLGRESYKRVLTRNHGVREPCFGVPISELKKFQRTIKKDHLLALDLYASGNYDAMYLAGLIADDARMSPADLRRWADQAYGGSLPGTTVPSVAAGNPHGPTLAQEWLDSHNPHLQAIGWATWCALVSVKPDDQLDLGELQRLLDQVRTQIHSAPDRVRYQMNNFVIAVGCFVPALTQHALETAQAVGPVEADLGPNDCQVPSAIAYIRRVQDRGALGKKRRSAKC